MKKPAALLIACTLVSSVWSPSRAETPGMEEVLFSNIPTVITASLKRQALDQVPGSMTVITDREIRARGYLNLIDALTTVPGFKMYQEGFEGLISPVIRGYQWVTANVKLMVDGHAVNDPFHKGWENWQEMPLDDVKQIEVIRGPGSSLYGSDAFSAVVNIITKDAAGGQVTATGGTLGAWGGSATVAGARDRDLRYKASFSQQGEQGGRLHYQKDFISDYLSGFVPSQSLAPKTNRKMFKRHDASAVVEYKGLSVTARHVETVRQWSEGYVGIMSEERSWIPKRTSYVEASYKTALPDASELTLTASFDTDVNHYRGQFLPRGFYWDPFDSNSAFPDGAFYHVSARGDQQRGRGLWRKEAGGHDLTAGVEYSKVYFPWARTVQNYDPITLYPFPGGFQQFSGQDPNNWFAAEDTSESHWGAFGQDMFTLEPLSFILGGRYDHYSLAGAAFSPRLALIWSAPSDMIVKASFGQAFFSPYSVQRYNQVFGYVAKKDLRPATIQTWELSLQSSYL
jgi:outer membrane cobalamin receptor